jgi:hypothetical protein
MMEDRRERETADPSVKSNGKKQRRRRERVFGVSAAVGLVAIAVIGVFTWQRHGVRSEDAAFNLICDKLDSRAAAVVAGLAADASDDGVFRLRRARRNCRTGWVSLACQDYQALLHGTTDGALASECLPAVMAERR